MYFTVVHIYIKRFLHILKCMLVFLHQFSGMVKQIKSAGEVNNPANDPRERFEKFCQKNEFQQTSDQYVLIFTGNLLKNLVDISAFC